ncbi:HNH nuclease, partial [Klenkia terrae]|uniref:HNH endonuclease signature motif containing protein n=1 Tax=Klenkia terrae TaxID=1052259 RepID=UPI00175CA1EB
LDDLGPLTNPPADQPPPDADGVDEATDADDVDDGVDDGVDEATDAVGVEGATDAVGVDGVDGEIDAVGVNGAAGVADTPVATLDGAAAGSGVGAIGGLPVSPVAVAELLARYDALLASGARGRVQGGDVWFEILDTTGRLRALTSPAEARAALRRGTGLGPPPRIADYEPNAAQTRFVKARDQHCRFPGCSRPAEYVDLDHAIPYDHHDPTAGGPTCVTNLVCLCRRHHRLKTHAPGWVFAMDPDGTLHVTPPGGRTRTTRPSGIAEVDMSTPTHLDTLTDLLGPTPKRFRSPTPEQRAARRAAGGGVVAVAGDGVVEVDVPTRPPLSGGDHGVVRGGHAVDACRTGDNPMITDGVGVASLG